VVIESRADIDRLVRTRRPLRQAVMLRILPTQLGFAATAGLPAGDDDRFGLPVDGDELTQLVAVAARMKRTHGVRITELNLGGRFAVAQTADDLHPGRGSFAARMRRVLALECRAPGIDVPRLSVTPGRAIVARAGIALYRVTAVRHEPKRSPAGGHRRRPLRQPTRRIDDLLRREQD